MGINIKLALVLIKDVIDHGSLSGYQTREATKTVRHVGGLHLLPPPTWSLHKAFSHQSFWQDWGEKIVGRRSRCSCHKQAIVLEGMIMRVVLHPCEPPRWQPWRIVTWGIFLKWGEVLGVWVWACPPPPPPSFWASACPHPYDAPMPSEASTPCHASSSTHWQIIITNSSFEWTPSLNSGISSVALWLLSRTSLHH